MKITATSSTLYYGIIAPFNVLVFIIALSYTVVSPLVMLPAVVYFAVAWLVYKNQLLYVYVKHGEGNGSLWILIYNRCIFGLYVFQFFIIGLFSAKQAPYIAILALMLLPATHLFNKYCWHKFHKHGKYVPLNKVKSVSLDFENMTLPTTTPTTASLNEQIIEMNRRSTINDYMSPVFTKNLPHIWVPAYVAHLHKEEMEMFEITDESL